MLGSIYVVALVVGGLLLGASVLGDFLGVDDITGDPDAGDAGGGLHLLTLRGATYFAFVFGAIGTGLRLLAPGTGTMVTFVLALTLGLATGSLVDRLFAWIRRNESSSMEGDRSLHGLVGHVVVPLSARHEGKISVRRGAERLELLARPFDRDDGDPAEWKQVIIIDVRDGTALVSPDAGTSES
jgi:membrane protein implicated in regulation of membrane protease activity